MGDLPPVDGCLEFKHSSNESTRNDSKLMQMLTLRPTELGIVAPFSS